MRNVVRKALLLARGYAIGPEVTHEACAPHCPAVDQTFAEYVSELLAQAIQPASGDQSKAARWLGVARPTMLDKLSNIGLRSAAS